MSLPRLGTPMRRPHITTVATADPALGDQGLEHQLTGRHTGAVAGVRSDQPNVLNQRE